MRTTETRIMAEILVCGEISYFELLDATKLDRELTEKRLQGLQERQILDETLLTGL